MQVFERDVQDRQQPILPVVQHLRLHQGRWGQLEAGAPGLHLHVMPHDCGLQKVPKEGQGNVAIERGQHQVRSGQLRCCDVEGRPVLFPEVEVKGCVFHWTQAVWRRRQNQGTAEQLHLRCHHPDLHQEAATTTLSAWPTHHDDVRQAKGEGHPGPPVSTV